MMNNGQTARPVLATGTLRGYSGLLITLLSLGVLTFLAYLRSLNGFLVLDDYIFIEPSKLGRLLPHMPLRVRSVSVLSLALNYHISGMNLMVFRATNVLLHIGAGYVVFYLTYITMTLPHLRERWKNRTEDITPLHFALAAAVLFLLHPLQTSAVNYITQRMAIMAALFSFAGLVFYVRSATGNSPLRNYLLSAIFFVLAIFSKENAVLVLLMIPVYDLIFIASFQWKEFRKRFIPFSAVLIVLTALVGHRLRAGGFIAKVAQLLAHPHQPIGYYGWTGVDILWTPVQYLLTELRVVAQYLLLFLFPAPSRMVFDYANAFPVSQNLLHPITTVLSFFLILGLLFLSLWNLKKLPLLSFGILWYFVTISLESFIALGLDPYFEHRNYLPGLGLCIALASLLPSLDAGLPNAAARGADASRRLWIVRNRFGVALALLAVSLFLLTFIRNGVWEKEHLLWKDTLDKVSGNPRALISLSSIYINERRFAEAEEYINRASTLPVTEEFRSRMLINKASLYKETNRPREAINVLRELMMKGTSLSRRQKNTAYYIMGEILRDAGRLQEAKEYLEKAYAMNKGHPGVLVSLGLVSRSLGENSEAERYYHQALAAAPQNVIAHAELGDMSFSGADIGRAERHYAQALASERDMPPDIAQRVLLNMAQIQLTKGNSDGAEQLLKKIVSLDPSSYQSYAFLGDIHIRKGDFDTALSFLEKAAALHQHFVKGDPNAALIYFNLGTAYLRKGEKRLAQKNLEFFLSLARGDARLESQAGKARELLTGAGMRP